MNFLYDLITRLRNAQHSHQQQRIFPLNIKEPKLQANLDNRKAIKTKSIIRILNILRHEGFIYGFSVIYNPSKINNYDKKKQSILVIDLKYTAEGRNTFNNISIVSKQGRRIYLSSSALCQPQSNRGISVISTSQGIFTNQEARYKNLGGEILFHIS